MALSWHLSRTPSRSQHAARFAVTIFASGSGYASLGDDWKPTFLPKALRNDTAEQPSSWFSKPLFISKQGSRTPLTNQSSNGTKELQLDNEENRKPGEQAPPPQTKGHTGAIPSEESSAEDDSPWHLAVKRMVAMSDGIAKFDLGSKITDTIMPTWFKLIPVFINKLQDELSMAPGSLAEEIWWEAHDPEINPEILWDASVRMSNDLCGEEKDFLRKRRAQTTKALAKYLDVPERDVHPDDVPTIAICGSGGGLRALVAGTSSYLSAQEDGLFDCTTYTAGVSGSCWLQTLFYSSMAQQSHEKLIQHLKHRLGVHIAFPPAALGLLSSAPTNKHILSGLVEKLRGVPEADFGLVDVYGVLLAARLLVPKGDLNVDDYDLKISNQRRYTDEGQYPLPIYTAVRHEIPKEDQFDGTRAEMREKARKEAWFQWFEWTPYEFFCEELEAGIPTWAVGRKFENGRNLWRENGLALPELRVPLMMGIWGSAFCATLSHYYKEVRPVLTGLAGFAGLDHLIAEREDDMVKVHPIDPAVIPNFAFGMKNRMPATCPKDFHEVTHLQLMDAGMSNNLPIYPLLRPGRDVDVLIAFDASADVRQDNWIRVADGYARKRGIKGWPLGAGWPSSEATKERTVEALETAQETSPEEAGKVVAKIEKSDAKHDNQSRKEQQPQSSETSLGYCTVWVGTTEEHRTTADPAPSKSLEPDRQPTSSSSSSASAGLTLIYFPLLANPSVPGVDPQKSDFLSTWNFVYTPEEVDKVVALARANFDEGKERTRRTVRAVWERKRDGRVRRERVEKEERRRGRVRRGVVLGRKGVGDHGDQFS
ncbi:hypothetical protein LTR66_006381 [Elasticomyces elasticus]|nr:hypothetical protein LTR66_006381 [Elasticomyces elasticus]